MERQQVRSEHEITILRPADQVFAVLSDVRNTPKWHPSAIEEYFTSDPPVGVGSTRKSIAKAFGIRVENEAEVTVFDPNNALGLRSIQSPVPFEISILLTEVDGATTITWTEDLRPSGFLRAVTRVTSRLQNRQTRIGLRQLKQLIESGAL
jgi:uncharacterized membrane protein